MSSWICEISGEPLNDNTEDIIVVTPSGHVCKRRLLLQTLTENGGIDPFEEKDRPLTEDELIEIKKHPNTSSSITVPNNNNSNNIRTNIINLQKEYDAVVLELYETRKVLKETRQELSQALYQNDASVRVIARLAIERDQAKSALEQFKVHTNSNSNGNSNVVGAAIDNQNDIANGEEPVTKKMKLIKEEIIPKDDLQQMMDAWETLHQNRKARQKKAGKEAIKPEQIKDFQLKLIETNNDNKKSSDDDKTSCEHNKNNNNINKNKLTGLSYYNPIEGEENTILYQTCRDMKEIILYKKDEDNNNEWKVSLSKPILSCLCANGDSFDKKGEYMVVGYNNGNIDIIQNNDYTLITTCKTNSNGPIINVRIHQDLIHFIAITIESKLIIGRLISGDIIATFTSEEEEEEDDNNDNTSFTSGTLHPDGLIYIVGTNNGKLLLYDFKSQSLAGKLIYNDESTDDRSATAAVVTAVEVSNNGYHIAAIYANKNVIIVWDLRKQSIIAQLNNTNFTLTDTSSVQFDDSGKYLAYSGINNNDNNKIVVQVVTVKEWTNIVTLTAPDENYSLSSGLQFGKTWIAVSATMKDNNNINEPNLLVFTL